MTCIIGVEAAGGAWIGSDSACTSVANETWRYLSDRPKYVLRTCGRSTMAFAIAGSWMSKQIAERSIMSIPRPRRGEDDLEYLARAVVHPIRDAHGASEVREKDDSVEGLIVFGGRVYIMFTDYAIFRAKPGYAAVGSGSEYALGAICGIREATRNKPVDPESCVRAALHAAAEHSTAVAAPFHVAFIRGG